MERQSVAVVESLMNTPKAQENAESKEEVRRASGCFGNPESWEPCSPCSPCSPSSPPSCPFTQPVTESARAHSHSSTIVVLPTLGDVSAPLQILRTTRGAGK